MACLLISALMTAPALAEVYTGATIARSSTSILSPASGVLEEICIQPGATVQQGETIARLRTTRVYAQEDGTIAVVEGEEGREIDGTVLSIQPVSRFDVYCTLDGGYDTIANNLVHVGEEMYLSCTTNGTHQGAATVSSIDGETFMALATGGEFYNGETVYLYRDPDFTYASLIGKGTVLAASAQEYQDSGRIVKMHVAQGEYVQRGELLYEIIDGEETEITAPADGVITACQAQEGANAQQDAALATLVPWEEILVSVQVEEAMAAKLSPGDAADMTYAADSQELLVSGTVEEISHLAQDGMYTVYIRPETPPSRLGMTVQVRLDP